LEAALIAPPEESLELLALVVRLATKQSTSHFTKHVTALVGSHLENLNTLIRIGPAYGAAALKLLNQLLCTDSATNFVRESGIFAIQHTIAQYGTFTEDLYVGFLELILQQRLTTGDFPNTKPIPLETIQDTKIKRPLFVAMLFKLMRRGTAELNSRIFCDMLFLLRTDFTANVQVLRDSLSDWLPAFVELIWNIDIGFSGEEPHVDEVRLLAFDFLSNVWIATTRVDQNACVILESIVMQLWLQGEQRWKAMVLIKHLLSRIFHNILIMAPDNDRVVTSNEQVNCVLRRLIKV
jgi:hypothetical protein